MIRAEQTAVLVAANLEEWERVKLLAATQADAGATVVLANATRTATITSITTLTL